MTRGWQYTKLECPSPFFLWYVYLVIVPFLFVVCVSSVCSRVDVPLIFFCPADHVPDWQPRILLGMVEARSVKAVV